jgi:hypothetical protein
MARLLTNSSSYIGVPHNPSSLRDWTVGDVSNVKSDRRRVTNTSKNFTSFVAKGARGYELGSNERLGQGWQISYRLRRHAYSRTPQPETPPRGHTRFCTYAPQGPQTERKRRE